MTPSSPKTQTSPVNTTDKIGSVIVTTTKVGRQTNGSDWLQTGHYIEEATADRVSKTKKKNHYNLKIDFETMIEIQDFKLENISMGRSILDSTPIGTNTTNGTT